MDATDTREDIHATVHIGNVENITFADSCTVGISPERQTAYRFLYRQGIFLSGVRVSGINSFARKRIGN